MTKELTSAVFDYSVVDKDTKGKLIRLAGQIKSYGAAVVSNASELRKAVHEAHSLLAKERKGLFEEWVERETDVGISTAYNMLHVEERSADFPIIGKMPPTVGYMFAPPSVPDAAIKALETAVKRGAKPTVELAKSTLAGFRNAADKPKGGKTSAPKKLPSQSDEPPTPAEDEPGPQRGPSPDEESDDAGKLFSKLLEHLRQATLLLDQINNVSKDDKLRGDIFQSLEVANEDIIKWRKSAKTRR